MLQPVGPVELRRLVVRVDALAEHAVALVEGERQRRHDHHDQGDEDAERPARLRVPLSRGPRPGRLAVGRGTRSASQEPPATVLAPEVEHRCDRDQREEHGHRRSAPRKTDEERARDRQGREADHAPEPRVNAQPDDVEQRPPEHERGDEYRGSRGIDAEHRGSLVAGLKR